MLKRVGNIDGIGTTGEGIPSITPVSLRDVSYLSGEKVLLDKLTFTIPSQSRTVILGANGAGKSLLLRILHGLISPTSGSVLWNGVNANSDVRECQAMVFQRPVLLRRSALKNIEFVLSGGGAQDVTDKALKILDDANLGSVSGTPARLLSGGEQQRLAIARAMANDPKIVFLDEPTNALDPASIDAVERMIDVAHGKGVKIVMVTHDLGQARRMADDVVFLDRGCVTESGPAKEFFGSATSAPAQAYLGGVLYLGDAAKPTLGDHS